ncbi:choice-of-anchor L domain-containing protein [Microbulbifer sp. TYP-18]|uniref:choice-of-anchor L domain-containing protein n=1 Tax=Microbulbifer sp. TYP-18 TaxID=3230024 RepID=UPI0034C618C3
MKIKIIIAALIFLPGFGTNVTAQIAFGGIKVSRNTDAIMLAQRLVPSNDPRLTFVTGVGTFLTADPVASSGLYTAQNVINATTGEVQILNNYDLAESGVILSTGDVKEYESGPNDFYNNAYRYNTLATAAQDNLLRAAYPKDPTGISFYDASQLDVTVDSCSAQRVVVEFAYGSDEWDEFNASGYTDVFAIFVDRIPVDAVIVNPINFADIRETELDGVEIRSATPLIRAIFSIPSGRSAITFMISDVNDDNVDSTVYIEPIRSLADYNQDGSADFFDISLFLNDYNESNLRADLNGDGILTEADANIIQAEFDAGCP